MALVLLTSSPPYPFWLTQLEHWPPCSAVFSVHASNTLLLGHWIPSVWKHHTWLASSLLIDHHFLSPLQKSLPSFKRKTCLLGKPNTVSQFIFFFPIELPTFSHTIYWPYLFLLTFVLPIRWYYCLDFNIKEAGHYLSLPFYLWRGWN